MSKNLVSKLLKSSSGRGPSELLRYGTSQQRRINLTPARNLAQIRSDIEVRSEAWFTPSGTVCQIEKRPSSKPDVSAPDERTLKLGSSMSSSFLLPKELTDI